MVTKIILGMETAGVIVAWILDKWNLLPPVLVLLSILMIVDYISGMLASKKEALEHPNNKKYGWSSKKSIIGIYKKGSYILVILVAVSTDLLLRLPSDVGIKYKYNTMFGLLVSIWLIINELLSILENAGRLGAKLPNIIKKVLAELQSNIDEKFK